MFRTTSILGRQRRRLQAFTIIGLCALASLAVLGESAGAEITRQLDYETGHFSQWDAVQALPGRAAVVASPRRQGAYAARFEVRPGDDPINASGERAEVLAQTGEVEGTESWWAWSTMFPTEFQPNSGSWNTFTQWHHAAPYCPPPVSFAVDNGLSPPKLKLRVWGGTVDTTTCSTPSRKQWHFGDLERNKWNDFVFHIKWSANPSVGFVELWLNDTQVIPKTYTATLYAGVGVYVKQGFYRGESSLTTALYHDGLRRGTTLADLFSPPTSPPPPPPPPPPPVSLTSSIKAGETLSGRVSWNVGAPEGAKSVEFWADNTKLHTDRVAPFGFGLDTTRFANGPHDLGFAWTDASSTRRTQQIGQVTIDNPVRPEVRLITDFLPVTDPGCLGCLVSSSEDTVQARIEGGADEFDTAYGLKDFGDAAGWSGRVWTRGVVRLGRGRALRGDLALFQVRDVNDALVYELYVAGGDRTIRLWSPPGGLSAKAINASTGVRLRPGGVRREVQVSARKDDSVIVRVDRLNRLVLGGLRGATTGNQRYIRAGIDHYDAEMHSEAVVTSHRTVGVSNAGWLEPVAFRERPIALRHRQLAVRVHTLPGKRVTILVRGRGGRLLGAARATANAKGVAVRRVRMARWHGHRRLLKIVAKSSFFVDGRPTVRRAVLKMRLSPREHRRARS